MIKLTKLNGQQFILNCELIETVETTPDTIISTVNSRKYVVREGMQEIIDKVIEYKKETGFLKSVGEKHSEI